jgi:hypothetical protein
MYYNIVLLVVRCLIFTIYSPQEIVFSTMKIVILKIGSNI